MAAILFNAFMKKGMAIYGQEQKTAYTPIMKKQKASPC
jgi:hypothetical protein